MSIVELPSYLDCWSQKFRYDNVTEILLLKRYHQIRNNLHFSTVITIIVTCIIKSTFSSIMTRKKNYILMECMEAKILLLIYGGKHTLFNVWRRRYFTSVEGKIPLGITLLLFIVKIYSLCQSSAMFYVKITAFFILKTIWNNHLWAAKSYSWRNRNEEVGERFILRFVMR